MAKASLKIPRAVPSPEVQNAALFFSQLAWNLSNGVEDEYLAYKPLLYSFRRSNPFFWFAFKHHDPAKIIDMLVDLKNGNIPTTTGLSSLAKCMENISG